MKYIRKAMYTPMNGKLPDNYITEMVDEDKFTDKHYHVGGWDLVTDEVAEQMMAATMEMNKPKPLTEEEQLANKAKIQAKIKQEAAFKEEFEAFKAWKASQEPV